MSQTDDPDRAIDALVAKLTTDLETTTAAPRFGWAWVLLYAFVVVVSLLAVYLLSTLVPANSVGAFAGVLSGLAALALAILTAFLLVLNQRLIATTLRMARATAAEALATLAEARATTRQVAIATRTMETMQVDQEMAWRPYLMVIREPGSSAASLLNVGRGPALRAVLVERVGDGTWRFAGPMDVAVGPPAHRFGLQPMPNPAPRELLGHSPAPELVVVCCDQFGNWFRFEPLRPAPIVWRPASDAAKPDWVEWTETFDRGPEIEETADADGNVIRTVHVPPA